MADKTLLRIQVSTADHKGPVHESVVPLTSVHQAVAQAVWGALELYRDPQTNAYADVKGISVSVAPVA